MEKKIRFVVVGLVVLLGISLFITLQVYNSKTILEREVGDLKRETMSLTYKINDLDKEKRVLEERVSGLSSDMERIARDKADIQNKFDALIREKEDLSQKLQAGMVTAAPQVQVKEVEKVVYAPAPGQDEAYWAQILEEKTELEMQLGNLREELKLAQVESEKVSRERASLELEIENLNREKADLLRQLEYNKKVADNITKELVKEKQNFLRERSDKNKIMENVKVLKNENVGFRRQLKGLSNRKTDLDRKLITLEEEKTALKDKLDEVDIHLREKIMQIDALKEELEDVQAERADKKDASIELPPIIVRPQETEQVAAECLGSKGAVVSVNRKNNFAIINLGSVANVKVGDNFTVCRSNAKLADLKVIQVRTSVSACDILNESAPIEAGDTVN